LQFRDLLRPVELVRAREGRFLGSRIIGSVKFINLSLLKFNCTLQSKCTI